MRALVSMDTIQIEITNHCYKNCANCSRFVNLVRKPYMMDFEYFKQAVDSMVGYPKMTGIQGGEPLLHPDFERMCEYLQSKIPTRQLGLWTTLPPGKEHYADIICKTFEHIFVNDHDGPPIYHQSPLVAAHEVFKNPKEMWIRIDGCWVQESWSASINPRGAFFCEIAASLSMLFEHSEGWPVEPEWWTRIPAMFWDQMQQACPRCGYAVRTDLRDSNEGVDDISPLNFDALKGKVRNPGRLQIHAPLESCKPQPQMAAYKDTNYRNRVAARYGMRLFVNEMGFWTPYMVRNSHISIPTKSVLETLEERMH